ncbi:MAG: hypothetical protein OXD01_16045 [Gammaproteobacteria bacterium]|nr:hypothetical protein [Gammaproteobacteria bacterium]
MQGIFSIVQRQVIQPAIVAVLPVTPLAGAPAGCARCSKPVVSYTPGTGQHIKKDHIVKALFAVWSRSAIEANRKRYPAASCAGQRQGLFFISITV